MLFTSVICNLGTVSGRMSDLTTGGQVGPDGRTGELAHRAADVSCVTSLALEKVSCVGLEDVRNTLLSFDFRPGTDNNNINC